MLARSRHVVMGAFAAFVLVGCAVNDDPDDPPPPLGAFRLGHNIAIADDVQLGPFSRSLGEAEIETAVQDAVDRRLAQYDGDGLYHLGIVVGGLVLAQPGVPLLYSPKSVMIIDVSVFDNSTQTRLNEEPERIVVGEGLKSAVPLIGSGLARSAEQQVQNLSASAAREILNWLAENPQWFAPKPGQVRVPFENARPNEDLSVN